MVLGQLTAQVTNGRERLAARHAADLAGVGEDQDEAAGEPTPAGAAGE